MESGSAPTTAGRRRSRLLRADLLLPPLVLAISLLVTHLLWQQSREHLVGELQIEFDASVREMEFFVGQRLAEYEGVLTGVQGLYAASSEVDQGEFNRYVATLNLTGRYPAVENIAFLASVPEDRKEQRSTTPGKQQALPPEGHLYAPEVMLVTLHGNASPKPGMDYFADAEYRATLERARDSETLALSGIANGGTLLMALPVYRNNAPHDTPEARRANIAGWITASFSVREMMPQLMQGLHGTLDIAIHDGTETASGSLLYASAQPGGAALFQASRQLQAGDRLWTLSFASRPAFDARLSKAKRLDLLATGGIAIGLLLALLSWLLLHSRRKALLATDRLAEAKEQAEAASQAKNEFLANISHELRTPMNIMLGMLHLLRKDETDPKRLSLIGKTEFAGQNLLGIINDILDLIDLEEGRIKADSAKFMLRDLLAGLERHTVREIGGKDIRFSIDAPDTLPGITLSGDRQRMEQLLCNYLDNAAKFTTSGHITLRIVVLDEDGASCRLRFEVEDSGIGIDPADLHHLFQPFWQADASSTREHGGTGLSLAICKELAATMDEGEVGAESRLGRGSTFWFAVRLAKPILATETAGKDESSRLDNIHILLAEDNQLAQMVMRELLDKAGAIVHPASNGEEVLTILKQMPCDCVLMDIQMPVMDGIEATRRIRSDPALKDLPVIAVTAHASEENRARCMEAGMNDFLGKPFTPGVFYDTIARWLSASHRQAAPQPAPTGQRTALAWSCDPEVIDLSVLAELIGDNPERMLSFATRFVTLARGDMAHIESALERGDMEMLGKLAHHNKGPARMVGAQGFADLCEKLIELSCADAPQDDIRETIARMHPLLDSIEQRVRKELTQDSPA